jgi:hypothetical protein
MNNKVRMNQIIIALSESGARELAEILSDVLKTCPVFSEQEVNDHEFIESLMSILHGLTFRDLEKYMPNDGNLKEQRITLIKISSQAAQAKNALCIFEKIVILQN